MLLAFLFTILAVAKTSFSITTENVKSGIQNAMPANSSMPPIFDATASKLIRYRSKPPPNFLRHKNQPPHKRPRPRIVKSPKVKNNRPMFTHFEQSLQPSSYYKFKPEIHTSTLAYKPSYSYDEVLYEVSSEYPKKESNYETQSMDLDFYGETYPKKKTITQYEYSKPQKSYTKPQKTAVVQYEFKKPHKTFTAQRPHNLYGSPKESSSSYNSYDFNFDAKPEVHYEISYHEESPEHVYEPAPKPKMKYEDFPRYGAPPKKSHQPEYVSYQIPDSKYEAPASPYHPQELPSKEEPYEKKLSNSGYNYNNNDFGEPPTDIHIIHSPSYDIETLPKKHAPSPNNYEQGHETYGPPPSDNYERPPSDNYGPPPSGNYGPPPSENYGPPPSDNYGPPPSDNYGPLQYNKKSQGNSHAPTDSYHQPNSGQFAEPPGSYLPPPHLPEDLPLNKNHMPPGYDYPKSSYEVPLYDPIPFESSTEEQEDDFPPNNYKGPSQHEHEHVSESSTNIKQIPSTSSSVSTTSSSKQEHEQVQANTKVHRFVPSKRRYKKPSRYQTTAKIPISTEEENRVPEAPSSEFLDELMSTSSTLRPRRKRKRTKAPLVAEKHNLDAPELEEAFKSGLDHDQTDELTAHASTIKENIEPKDSSKTQKTTEFSPSHSWNPLRIRKKPIHNGQRGQRTAQNGGGLNDLKNVEVISIQKSHSHSYYAGTEPPALSTKRTRTMTSRADAIQMPTISTTTLKADNILKPTRGLVIDTTYFKIKSNDEEEDEDFYDGTGKLPKNHKLF